MLVDDTCPPPDVNLDTNCRASDIFFVRAII